MLSDEQKAKLDEDAESFELAAAYAARLNEALIQEGLPPGIRHPAVALYISAMATPRIKPGDIAKELGGVLSSEAARLGGDPSAG